MPIPVPTNIEKQALIERLHELDHRLKMELLISDQSIIDNIKYLTNRQNAESFVENTELAKTLAKSLISYCTLYCVDPQSAREMIMRIIQSLFTSDNPLFQPVKEPTH